MAYWKGIRKGALFIDMSTIAPAAAKELYEAFRQKGVEALDAPVSGGQVGAESASLSIMTGGNESRISTRLAIIPGYGQEHCAYFE